MYKVALLQKTWSKLLQFQKVSDGKPVIEHHHIKSYTAFKMANVTHF